MSIIGIDIGGTKILGAAFNQAGDILAYEKRASKGEEGFDAFITQLYDCINTLIEKNQLSIEAIGLGIPGIVSPQGFVVLTPNLPLKDIDLVKRLEEKYNVPVAIGNDVNLGTFGEYKYLNLDHSNVIGLFPGTGLGGGIIIDGNLYIGQGFAGELGHIVVEKNGLKCNCGNRGCLESYASKKGLLKYMKKQLKKGRRTRLKADIEKGILKSSRLKKAYDAKDEVTVEAIDQMTRYLGMGVGLIMNIFNPEVIILGGGIIEAFGEKMVKKIHQNSKKYAMPGIYRQTTLKQSALGDDAVVYGAYHLIKEKLLKLEDSNE